MKILMVIAKKDFRDEELQVPLDYFEEKKITVDIASTEAGDCVGKNGLVATAERSFDDVVVEEYFGIVLVGGRGSAALDDDEKLISILRRAEAMNIVIAAICRAPVILAKAGVLRGKHATVWNKDGSNMLVLNQHGVDFVDEDVVVDGLYVTANGPEAARKFAEKVVEVAECSDCWIK